VQADRPSSLARAPSQHHEELDQELDEEIAERLAEEIAERLEDLG